ncbi:MAG: hypothetical protein K8Q89_02515 [Nitrosarchaeum sp.]|nr:hypothetical protein [Nitrosarchaeum sp.]
MKQVKLPTQFKTKLRNCPTGCTQRRTKNYRLAEKRTFDGRKCSNCGFITITGEFKPQFQKFQLLKPIV